MLSKLNECKLGTVLVLLPVDDIQYMYVSFYELYNHVSPYCSEGCTRRGTQCRSVANGITV